MADSYLTPKNTTLTMAAPGVLANDTDADGDSLTSSYVTDLAHGTPTHRRQRLHQLRPAAGYPVPTAYL